MNKSGTAEKESYQSLDATSRNPTLAEVGIIKSMSSRAQRIASVPKSEFKAVIQHHKESVQEFTKFGITVCP